MSTGAHKIADIVGVSGNEKSLLYKSIKTGGGGSSKVEPEEKDVNFYDYDGTRMYSFTKEEFLALNEMPATHDREEEELVSNGWNWDFEEAKTHVETYRYLNIGAQYTADFAAKIFVTIEEHTKAINFSLTAATIDWGDGTIGGSNHTYSTPGNYIITITGSNVRPTNAIRDFPQITKIITSTFFLTNGLLMCPNLENLCILSDTKSQNLQQIDSLNSLKCIVLPKNIQYLSICKECRQLKYFILSDTTTYTNISGLNTAITQITVTKLNNTTIPVIPNQSPIKRFIVTTGDTATGATGALYGTSLVIYPKTITNIPQYTLRNCERVKIVIYATTPPSLNSSAFYGISYPGIYVPDESVAAYKAATNWSKFASRIYPISQANI